MKHFLIKYRFAGGSREEWHGHIAKFIAALNSDPAVKGKISYRCMKRRDGDDYYHLAAAVDDQASKALQSQEFFARYTEQSKAASGGTLEVVPLETIAETEFQG